VKPRVLFVGRTRYRLPLSGPLARKWDALAEVFELRVLASGVGPEDPRFRLVGPGPLDGPRFYLTLPVRVVRELRSFRPQVVVAESAYEAVAVELARRVTRSGAKTIVEVHGDWRTSTRLYGSRARALVGPLGDRLATWVIRRADAVRAVSEFTASLVRGTGREPAAVFTAYTDLSAFAGPVVPVPDEPRALFVGVLERYKNVDGLAAAWRLVERALPAARLLVIGVGRERALVEQLVRESSSVTWEERRSQAGIADALDGCSVLVLPSRSEGLPRIVIEAFCRGRPVVGARAGGIPDIVADGVNGLVVAPEDPAALADAIVRVLSDAGLRERLAEGARASVDDWLQTPEQFAARLRELVASV
jgi:glycosyltransferase involved in cell wall biosynthesis